MADKSQNVPHIELATLFFCQCVDQYLRKNGVIAFVMPRSVLVSSHHQNFLKFKKPLVKLTKIYDLEDVSPIFRIPSCTLFATKGTETQYPVPRSLFAGDVKVFNQRLEKAKNLVTIKDSRYTPSVRSTNLSYYYDKFSEGATILPRRFWDVDIRVDSTILGYDSTNPFIESRYNPFVKKPWDKIKLEGNIEKNSYSLQSTVMTWFLLDI